MYYHSFVKYVHRGVTNEMMRECLFKAKTCLLSIGPSIVVPDKTTGMKHLQ